MKHQQKTLGLFTSVAIGLGGLATQGGAEMIYDLSTTNTSYAAADNPPNPFFVTELGIRLTVTGLNGGTATLFRVSGASGGGFNGVGVGPSGAGIQSSQSEVLQLTFDTDVIVKSITLSQFAGESALISLPGVGTDFTISDDGTTGSTSGAGASLATYDSATDVLTFTGSGFHLDAGGAIGLAGSAGGGYFCNQVEVAPVPEPGMLGLID